MAYTNLTYEDRLNNALLKTLWLQRDLADFIAFNPVKFSPQFVTDATAAYQDALNVPTDENISDIGTQKTANVATKMEASRYLYQKKVKYFLEEAFLSQTGILNSFGYNDYSNVRVNVSGMISFLTNLEIRCGQEKNALLAVGISATIIDDIQAAKNELITAYTEQQTFFGSQKDMTQTRKMAFDAMDVYIKDICRAGKNIYEGINEAKYSDYVIYQTRTNTGVSSQTVAANTEAPILSAGINENVTLQLQNTGNTTLAVYVNDVLSANAVGYDLMIGATTIMTTNALSVGNYGKLIVRNANSIEGKIKVTIVEVVE
jgi:hypothetical protein